MYNSIQTLGNRLWTCLGAIGKKERYLVLGNFVFVPKIGKMFILVGKLVSRCQECGV